MYIMCFWSDYMGITTQSTGKNAYISNEFNLNNYLFLKKGDF